MEYHNFFLEIGCEELPSKILQPLIQALKENIKTELKLISLLPEADEKTKIYSFVTPRRLSIFIEELQDETLASKEKISGPPLKMAFDEEGKPTIATLKFAEKQNTDWTLLEKDTELNKLVFVHTRKAQKTNDLLPIIIEKAISALPIPKPMRWGNHAISFVRPVHWVVMIYNNQLIPATILGCKTTMETRGHRVHHPESISLITPFTQERYVEDLKNAYVVADFQERKAIIKKQLEEKAAELEATPILLEDLLDEVTGLVEWPVALSVPFEKRFLELPQEVLITSMQQHQKSFALKKDNQLIPYFLTVSNIERKDKDYSKIIAGNERVMKARLSDAAFFYEKDKKESLTNRREATKNVIFQAKLGTLYDKSERFIKLAHYLCSLLEVNKMEAELAASLSQCDLMTDMVGEFPELQGKMGYYYALCDGHSHNVAQALDEQYWPRFSGDRLPETSVGLLLAIAERVDTLVGAFSINQKPTGNKDPFKLRRHGLGLIRILIEKSSNKNLNVVDILSHAFALFKNHVQQPNLKTVEEAHEFILDRLRAYYNEQGYSLPVIQAVLTRQSTDLKDFYLRLQAVNEFSKWEEATALSAANKRVSRILSAEKETQGKISPLEISTILLVEAAEKNLVEALHTQQNLLPPLLEEKEYTAALKTLSTLREPIDAFFDNVMVNVEDEALRQNRLAILKTLHQLFLEVADLSCLS